MLHYRVRGEDVFFERDVSFKTTYKKGLFYFLDKNDQIEMTEIIIPKEHSSINFNKIGLYASTNSLDYLSKYIPTLDLDLSMRVDNQLALQYRNVIKSTAFPKSIDFVVTLDTYTVLIACRRAYYLIYSTKFEDVDISLGHGFTIKKVSLTDSNVMKKLEDRDCTARAILTYLYNHSLYPQIEFTYYPKFNIMDKMSIRCNNLFEKCVSGVNMFLHN